MTTPRQLVLGPSTTTTSGSSESCSKRVRRRRVDQIDVAGLQRAHGAGRLGNELDLDRVEVWPAAVPAIERGELESAADLDALRHDHERSGADRGDAELLVAHLLDDPLRHRGQGAAGAAGAGDGEERRERSAQGEGDGAVVGRLERSRRGLACWRAARRSPG